MLYCVTAETQWSIFESQRKRAKTLIVIEKHRHPVWWTVLAQLRKEVALLTFKDWGFLRKWMNRKTNALHSSENKYVNMSLSLIKEGSRSGWGNTLKSLYNKYRFEKQYHACIKKCIAFIEQSATERCSRKIETGSKSSKGTTQYEGRPDGWRNLPDYSFSMY
jgi:hypothetical protein